MSALSKQLAESLNVSTSFVRNMRRSGCSTPAEYRVYRNKKKKDRIKAEKQRVRQIRESKQSAKASQQSKKITKNEKK